MWEGIMHKASFILSFFMSSDLLAMFNMLGNYEQHVDQ